MNATYICAACENPCEPQVEPWDREDLSGLVMSYCCAAAVLDAKTRQPLDEDAYDAILFQWWEDDDKYWAEHKGGGGDE